MKRPVKCFEYGGSVLTCVKFQIGSTQSCLGPGSVKKEKGKNQRAKRTKGVDRLDWEGGKPAALSPSLIQQDKTRQDNALFGVLYSTSTLSKSFKIITQIAH